MKMELLIPEFAFFTSVGLSQPRLYYHLSKSLFFMASSTPQWATRRATLYRLNLTFGKP
jgi:hypothetical protein